MTSPVLRAEGVAVLLAYWAELYQPVLTSDRNGVAIPGVVCSGDADVTVRAVGYRCASERRRTLNEAAAVCDDAGLTIVDNLVPGGGGFVVRRRGGAA